MKNFYLSILLFLFIIGCRQTNDSNSDTNDEVFNEEGFSDGTYCAELDYYYSETGTSSTYILEVEIENSELTVIHWPNGGWLDSSHFSPPDISDGEATFTSDVGVDYTIRIIGSSGDCVSDSYAKDEDDLVREKEERETEEENRVREEEEQEEQEVENRRQQEEEERDGEAEENDE